MTRENKKCNAQAAQPWYCWRNVTKGKVFPSLVCSFVLHHGGWISFLYFFIYFILFYFIVPFLFIYLLSPNSKIYFSYTKAATIMVRENQALPVGKPWPSTGCCIPSHVRRHFSKPDAIRNKAFRLDYCRYHLNNFTIKWCFFNKNIRLNDMKERIQWNFTGIMQRIS